jgi:CRP-like cAMP-binding protein
MGARLATGPSASLIAKLANFAPLTLVEADALNELITTEMRFAADTDILAEGAVPRGVYLVQEGFACRYRVMPDGGRQILSFLLPGDLCDLHFLLGKFVDHSIGTLTPARIACLPAGGILDAVKRHRMLGQALWWSNLQDEAMLRERIVALGRRNAHGRIAYLLCELLWRHQAVGLARDETVDLPLTQTELGDALGLTPVHVSRVLKQFRDEGLIELEHHQLTIRDVPQLQRIAGFNSAYLRLRGAPDPPAPGSGAHG